MAAVTFTRKAAAELRGRFQLALEAGADRTRPADAGARDARLGPRSRTSSASSPAPSTRSARTCCASVRSRPACRPASPSWTKCEDTRLRRQSWRDYRSQLKSAGDPLILELLEAGVRPSGPRRGVRDGLRERRRGVSRPGTAGVPDAKAAWAALDDVLEGAPEEAAGHDRSPTRRARRSRARSEFRRQWRRGAEASRPGASAGRRCSRRGTASPRSSRSGGPTTPAEKKTHRGRDCGPARATSGPTSSSRSSRQWRQYVYRLASSLLTARPRLRRPRSVVGCNTLNYGDLLQPGRAACCARTPTCAGRCSRSTAGCSWTSSRTPIRSRPRSCSLLAAGREPSRRAGSRSRRRLADGAAAPRRAVRRRRPEAVDLPLPARRHRHLQRASARGSSEPATARCCR